MTFRITDQCTGCSRCAPHCPTGAILGVLGQRHRVVSARCIDCGACGAACPEDGAVLDERGEPCSGSVLGCVELGDAPQARGRCARVEPSRCTGCGECVSACPYDAMRVLEVPGRQRLVAVVLERRCTGCSMCELECTKGAVAPAASEEPRELRRR